MPDYVDSIVSNTPPAPEQAGQGGSAPATQSVAAGDHSSISGARLSYTHRSPGSLELRQEISLGPDSTADANANTAHFHLSELDYYFELQPFELEQGAKASAGTYVPMPPDAPLCTGRTYRIRVALSENQFRHSPESSVPTYKLKQEPFKITEEVSISLSLETGDPNVVAAVSNILPPFHRLSRGSIGNQYVEFEFTIRKGYALEFTLRLDFYRNNNLELPYRAATLDLSIKGSEAVPLPSPREVLDLPVEVEPPANTAILHVSPGGEGQLRLLGWIKGHPDSSLSLDVSEFKWAVPEDCATAEAYSQKLNHSFHDYNLNQETVTCWFEKALRSYGEGCGIVIVDETGCQIPWEMFKLKEGRYLGARAVVVRWAAAQYRSQHAAARFANPQYVGRVSAYVHPDDAKVLAGLELLSRLLPNPTTKPNLLEHDLMPNESESQVGLVYICYGGVLLYGDEETSAAGLRRFEPYQQDVELRFDNVGGILEPRPIFFANAPYTGLILKSGQKSCGLARAILQQVAASYIGVLAPVERAYAARFAQRLLEEAASEEGVKVAEFLRRQRAEAAAKVRTKHPQEEWERAVNELSYPFLYVYYGHPQDWLKIDCVPEGPTQQSEDDDV